MSREFQIDEITWNDLDMEEVLSLIDTSRSSVGSEKLRLILKTLLSDEYQLNLRNKRIEEASKDEAGRNKLKALFGALGKTKKTSFYDYIFRLNEICPKGSLLHLFLALLLIFSIALIFIKPVAGVIAFIIMVSVNISVYFRVKAGLEGYFNSVKYLVSLIRAANKISFIKTEMLKGISFRPQLEIISGAKRNFSKITSMSWLITNGISGSVIDVIMDYIRMLFHVDIIKFNSIVKQIHCLENEINEVYMALGEIEADICIAEYRKRLSGFCVPEFIENEKISADDIYHPLVSSPVLNSIETEKSVLLTGANASGKSTFLKAMAINLIFAQTISTCLATRFSTSFCKVYSSIALSDNILKKESYFVVEIKSLKRIFDADDDIRIVCFIDEILRGTNTVERIAASSELMRDLAKKNALVFAATHDNELTWLLKDCFSNYHFSERIEKDEIIFDYKLRGGASTSSNAIKLLNLFNFPEEAIDKAREAASKFIKTGKWL